MSRSRSAEHWCGRRVRLVDGVKKLVTADGRVYDAVGSISNTPNSVMLRSTNASGELTSRTSFRNSTIQDAWDNAVDGPNRGKLCPTCGGEVTVPPNSGQPRDWDVSHNPSWSNREFDPNTTTRQDVINNYQDGTSLECPGCNRSGENNDARFDE